MWGAMDPPLSPGPDANPSAAGQTAPTHGGLSCTRQARDMQEKGTHSYFNSPSLFSSVVAGFGFL